VEERVLLAYIARTRTQCDVKKDGAITGRSVSLTMRRKHHQPLAHSRRSLESHGEVASGSGNSAS